MTTLLPETPQKAQSLVDILQYRSETQSQDVVFRFLSQEEDKQVFTFSDLETKARAIAARLQKKGLQPGDRVILIYAPGLDFIAGFFGCLFAGVIAVPVYPPLNTYLVEKLAHILENSQAKLLLTTVDIQKKLRQLKLLKAIGDKPIIQHIAKRYWSRELELTDWDFEKTSWLTTDDISSELANLWQPVNLTGDHIAFLQYTSGSTGYPKGVILSHTNIVHNLAILHKVCSANKNTIGVNWLPPYHDMGLIGVILLAIYTGVPSVLMSPMSFLRNPFRWLKVISDYRATICAAPNFAYEYCVNKISNADKAKLDLSSWEVALNGAEPIHLPTLERFYNAFKGCGFRREALFPCYGLAEATLYVSGSGHLKGPQYHYFLEEDLQRHRVTPVEETSVGAKAIVSCGIPEQTVCIVDPETQQLSPSQEIGEVWVSGSCVAQGYWGREDETEFSFHAKILGEKTESKKTYLRTGDLGFVFQDQLYITGRIKDLIIIHGMNYYPQDIEQTVSDSSPMIRSGNCAAFSITVDNIEKLVVVAEVKSKEVNPAELCDIISKAIAEQHEISPYAIQLIQPKTLSKTTSGKLRRQYTKELFKKNKLILVYSWQTGESIQKNEGRLPEGPLETELCAMCSELLGRPIRVDEPFSQMGVDSLLATQIISRIRDKYDIELPIHQLFEKHTIAELAPVIAEMQKQGKQDE